MTSARDKFDAAVADRYLVFILKRVLSDWLTIYEGSVGAPEVDNFDAD